VPPTRRTAPRIDCDVLVLGAGLAGLRAAWAAAQFSRDAAPGLRVVVASPRKGPSGSSFANRNNALGMQAPSPAEADAFVAEVLRLATPGVVLPELVRALAEDAPARLAELLAMNLNFRREPHDEDGSLRRFPGCFSSAPRAVVFDGLAAAHAAFMARAHGRGVELLHGFAAMALDRDASGRVSGAQLAAMRGGGRLDIRAHAVVAALGGPAPLFARRICGPGGAGSGLSYGLLASAGAKLVNAPFVQFFWGEADTMAFVNPGALPWLGEAARLAASRRTHCPVAHGLPDRVLDLALLGRSDADGLVHVPGRPPLLLAAHAGNGGARIDARGRTSAAGLYACGECAGGMHGADRLGGGMVLSALCFGARAGEAAAQEAAGRARFARTATPPADATLRPGFLAWLRRGMQRHGLPSEGQRGGGGDRDRFLERLEAALRTRPDREALLARSALAVLGADGS